MNNTQKLIIIPALGALMLVGGSIAGYASIASAQTGETTSTRPGFIGMMRGNGAPHVDGTITAINGSTISVTADSNHGGSTYTVETSGASFRKAGAASSLSSFAVGEKIWAMGTVNGTTVTAKMVSNQRMGGKGGMGGHGPRSKHGVMGNVTAVNGSSISVTGMDGQSYTIDAAAATVQKMVAGTLTDVAVGDRIGVHGTVSGTTVTATTIMDDIPEKPMQ